MSTSVTMPALGESVTEGTVTRWLKQEGDQVQADEALLEVSTDKVDTEIPAPASGVLTKIVVGEDETVAVGTELAVIGGSGGGSGKAAAPQQAAPQQAAPQQTTPAPSLISAPAPQQAPAPAPQAAQPEQQAAPAQQAAPQSAPAPVQQQAPAPQQAAGGSTDSGGGDPAYVT